jgi:hypothetical protein
MCSQDSRADGQAAGMQLSSTGHVLETEPWQDSRCIGPGAFPSVPVLSHVWAALELGLHVKDPYCVCHTTLCRITLSCCVV